MKDTWYATTQSIQNSAAQLFSAKLFAILVCASLLLALIRPAAPTAAAGIIFVDADSTCVTACGGSWVEAYQNLQDALSIASSGSQIWVAEDIYYPDEGAGQTNDDVLSLFTIVSGVSVYGGFAGSETSLEQRDPDLHPTILSGDLEQNDANTDGNYIAETTADIQGANALHVVQTSNTDDTTVLDGFVITAGYANATVVWPNSGVGGGVLALNGNPTLANLVISGNFATGDGGGLYTGPTPGSDNPLTPTPFLLNLEITGNQAAYGGGMFIDNSVSTRLTNITFSDNQASYGGGLYTKWSNPELTNLTFSANTADIDGGGMYNESSNPNLVNVTLSGNAASGSGGGVYNYKSSLILTNTILANSTGGGDCVNDVESSLKDSSYNLIEDAANACDLTDGSNFNIVGTDPQLGSLADNGGFTPTFGLLPGSPAIDAGTDTNCPATDQRGSPRPSGSHCDIGAFEWQDSSTTDFTVFLPVILK